MEAINWENAKIWKEKANEKKEDYDLKWEWDCGFKLDFDGSLLTINSRFYPPHKNCGNWWEGNLTVYFLGDIILERKFKETTLDKLKNKVEKFTKHYSDSLKSRITQF